MKENVLELTKEDMYESLNPIKVFSTIEEFTNFINNFSDSDISLYINEKRISPTDKQIDALHYLSLLRIKEVLLYHENYEWCIPLQKTMNSITDRYPQVNNSENKIEYGL